MRQGTHRAFDGRQRVAIVIAASDCTNERGERAHLPQLMLLSVVVALIAASLAHHRRRRRVGRRGQLSGEHNTVQQKVRVPLHALIT